MQNVFVAAATFQGVHPQYEICMPPILIVSGVVRASQNGHNEDEKCLYIYVYVIFYYIILYILFYYVFMYILHDGGRHYVTILGHSSLVRDVALLEDVTVIDDVLNRA